MPEQSDLNKTRYLWHTTHRLHQTSRQHKSFTSIVQNALDLCDENVVVWRHLENLNLCESVSLCVAGEACLVSVVFTRAKTGKKITVHVILSPPPWNILLFYFYRKRSMQRSVSKVQSCYVDWCESKLCKQVCHVHNLSHIIWCGTINIMIQSFRRKKTSFRRA